MLYDILPPLIFFSSLGGVIVVLARVGRRRRQQAAASMLAQARQAVGGVPEHMLRPTQKSVQAIGSRVAIVIAALRGIPRLPIGAWARRALLAIRSRRWRWPKMQRPAVSVAAVAEAPPPRTRTRVVKRQAPAPKVAPAGIASALDQANVAIAAAQYQRAEEILVSYIVDHTRDVRAYMLLGQAAAGRKNWLEAMEIFEQVTRLNAQEPGVWSALGEAALASGKFTKALEALQRAHDADRGNVTVLRQLLAIAQRMDNRVLRESVQEELTVLEGEQAAVKR